MNKRLLCGVLTAVIATAALSGCSDDPEIDPIDYLVKEDLADLNSQAAELGRRLQALEGGQSAEKEAQEQAYETLRADVTQLRSSLQDAQGNLRKLTESVTKLLGSQTAEAEQLAKLEARLTARAKPRTPSFPFQIGSINRLGGRHYVALAPRNAQEFEMRTEGQEIGDGWSVARIDPEAEQVRFIHTSGAIENRGVQ